MRTRKTMVFVMPDPAETSFQEEKIESMRTQGKYEVLPLQIILPKGRRTKAMRTKEIKGHCHPDRAAAFMLPRIKNKTITTNGYYMSLPSQHPSRRGKTKAMHTSGIEGLRFCSKMFNFLRNWGSHPERDINQRRCIASPL